MGALLSVARRLVQGLAAIALSVFGVKRLADTGAAEALRASNDPEAAQSRTVAGGDHAKEESCLYASKKSRNSTDLDLSRQTSTHESLVGDSSAPELVDADEYVPNNLTPLEKPPESVVQSTVDYAGTGAREVGESTPSASFASPSETKADDAAPYSTSATLALEAERAESLPGLTGESVAEALPEQTDEAVAEALPEQTDEAVAEALPEQTDEAVGEALPEQTGETVAEALPKQTDEAVGEALPEQTDETVAEAAAEQTDETAVPVERSLADAGPLRESATQPPRYRAPSGAARRTPLRKPAQTARDSLGDRKSEISLPIEIRILLNRGGTCSVSLLPKSNDALPAEIRVTDGRSDIELVDLEEGWYQDVTIDDLGQQLRRGLQWWSVSERHARWTLSGREIFVLSESSRLRGFVTQPRLQLGRRQIVLCTTDQLVNVEHVLKQAGCGPYSILAAGDGAPDGWLVLNNVIPERPVRQTEESDILNIIRPSSEVDISLENGVRLMRSSWLAENPPTIRVYGIQSDAVYIDGKTAEMLADGSYRVEGWDSVNDHIVSCGSASKTYAIVPIRQSSSTWLAHAFPGRMHQLAGVIGTCGALVVATRPGIETPSVAVIAPPRNALLIGAKPGEVYRAFDPSGIDSLPKLACPPFSPIWALPDQPLRCDKRTVMIQYLPTSSFELSSKQQLEPKNIRLWCTLILDSRRKGLRVANATPELQALWQKYVRRAKAVWKSIR